MWLQKVKTLFIYKGLSVLTALKKGDPTTNSNSLKMAVGNRHSTGFV